MNHELRNLLIVGVLALVLCCTIIGLILTNWNMHTSEDNSSSIDEINKAVDAEEAAARAQADIAASQTVPGTTYYGGAD